MASADFPMVRKGFEPDAVRAYLSRVADDLRRGRAEAEVARLEAQRLSRELEDALAELETEPHTNEAIAILGDEANRIIHAAQESSQEIVTAAEAAAEDIRAKARAEAVRIAEEARRESVDFDGRLSGQADEVRAKLREEIRRARVEFAEEADRLRADARYEAEAIMEAAREEAQLLRTEVEAEASEREGLVASAAAERRAAAEAAAEARVAEARARAEAILAEAHVTRAAVLDELQAHRELLESHVRDLQDVRVRARSDLAVVRTTLSGLAAELEHVSVTEVVVPPLAVEVDIPSIPVPAADAESEAAAEADAEAESEGAAEAAADSGEAGRHEVDVIAVEESTGDTAEASERFGAAEPVPDLDDGSPGDAEIDALFERVVGQRHGTGVSEPEPAPAPVPAVHAVVQSVDDDDDWGFDDPGSLVVEPAEGDPTPEDAEQGETRRRVFAALHQLAVDTGEVPVVAAPGPGNGNGNGGGATQAAPTDDSLQDDSPALDLVPALTRKVKRALQEVENAARDADPGTGGVDVVAVLVEYLGGPAAEAMSLGLGPESEAGVDDAEVVVRVVCGTWAEELGAGLAAADATDVTDVVRRARGAAETVAVDLARGAYRAGRERARADPALGAEPR